MKTFKNVSLVIVVILSFIFSGCSKSNSIPNPPATPPVDTRLFVMVYDNNNNPVSNATVNLYLSQSDLLSDSNQQRTAVTDATGSIVFHNLSTTKYSVLAKSGCENNINNGINLSNALVSNTITTVKLTVSPTGTLKYTNTSTNPYTVYVNGNAVITLNGGTSAQSNFVASGSYTVRVLQQSGFVLYPTDESFTQTVTCGNTSTVSFP